VLSHIGSWLGVCGGGEPAGSVVEGWVVGRAGGARPPRAHGGRTAELLGAQPQVLMAGDAGTVCRFD
jgi:hypothetical protein